MHYYCHDKTNNYSKWIKDTTKLEEFKIVLGSGFKHSTATPYYSLQASAVFYYNLGEMTFIQGTTSTSKNIGYYTKVKNGDTEYTTGEKLGNELFKARNDASIRMLTLTELNTAIGRTDIDSTDDITDTTGIYQLTQLKNKLQGKTYSSSGGYCWIASPWPGNCNYVCRFTFGGDLVDEGNSSNYGVRPVITISSDIQLTQETDESGFEYYSIVD